jgi:hypothetical protein
MRPKIERSWKSSANNHIWSGVLDRLSRILACRKDAYTNVYDDIRYVLPFYLP